MYVLHIEPAHDSYNKLRGTFLWIKTIHGVLHSSEGVIFGALLTDFLAFETRRGKATKRTVLGSHGYPEVVTASAEKQYTLLLCVRNFFCIV